MSGLNKNQNGMGTVEIALIVVVVAMIGFVGWFVYYANHTASKNYNTVTSTKEPTFKQRPKSTTTSTSSTSSSSSSSSTQ